MAITPEKTDAIAAAKSILEEIISSLRPALKGCRFGIVLQAGPIPRTTYRPYPWGYLDGADRRGPLPGGRRPAVPCGVDYTLYISRDAWSAAAPVHRRLMLAALIAPVTFVPPEDGRRVAVWRIDRRMWVYSRVKAAEEAIGARIREIING